MTPPLTPRSPSTDIWKAWLLPGGIGLAAGAVGLVWLAGRTASKISGHGFIGPAYGWDLTVRILSGDVASLWPAVPPNVLWAVLAAYGALLLTLAAVAFRAVRRVAPGGRAAGLAAGRDIEGLSTAAAAVRAKTLRPSLAAVPRRKLAPGETGIALGRLLPRGPVLRASWEDVTLAVMAPRAGKTVSLAIPTVLDAPGAVVATSNKADLPAATAQLRRDATGQRVWIFDPQGVAHTERDFVWNPLAGVTTVDEARRLDGHFVQEVRGDRSGKDFWTSAAHDLLTGLLLAAGVSGRPLGDVGLWLTQPGISTPVTLLRDAGHETAAVGLAARQHTAPETREGVYETARTAAACLRDPQIMGWVTPRPGLDVFDPARFATTRQTLYSLSKDGAGSAGPLVAALTDRVMREATRAAERQPAGRLDPPLVVVLDEAANVCRISDLPDLYSHLGSRGVPVLTILQSYRQGVRVWGEDGMAALWSASTAKVVGAGIDDPRFAEDVSRLVGDHDVAVRSFSRGGKAGQSSETLSLRRQRILAPEDVRALPKGTALVLATGQRVAQVRLLPWHTGPRKAEIRAAIDAAGQELVRRAARP